MISSDMFIIL